MRVSVVICTHRPRRDLLARAVRAILPQIEQLSGAELLVVDNASPDPVATLPELASPLVRCVVEPRLGLTAARERAAAEVNGDLVIFVDDDNILADDYVKQAVRLFDDAEVGMLSGWIAPEYEVNPPHWLRRHEGALAIRRPVGTAIRLVEGFAYTEDFPVGAGMVVRAALLRAYFTDIEKAARIEGRRGDELLAGEDTDMALFMISRGARVGCVGTLRVTHVIPRARIDAEYIMRLNRGALRSAMAVNEKWRSHFGGDVFSFLAVPKWKLLLLMSISSVLAFVPSMRVRAAVARDLLRAQGSRRWI